MEWLNYHHLLYFWVVAREGGLVPAGKVLRLTHPTLSGQIKTLEERLGDRLFMRQGRRLALTELGRVVFRYADEIFSLGQEMLTAVAGRETGRPERLELGISEVVPKLVVRRLLEPVLKMAKPVHLVCREARFERLLADLSLRTLDVVITDAPLPPGSSVRAFNHLLCDSGITFFAERHLARRLRPGFPRSLDGARLLLPLDTSPLRRSLEAWFAALGIKPHVVAEFEDPALLTVFGADGLGTFPGSSVVEGEIARQNRVEVVGRTDEVRERFYAISLERRLKNEAVLAISGAAWGRS